MTACLRAAIACRAFAALAFTATVCLVHTGHSWWAVLAGCLAFLGVFFGGRFHLAHRRTIADQPNHTRHEETRHA